MIKGICKACGKETFSYPSRIQKFCSNLCARVGKHNGNYKNTDFFVSSRKPNFCGEIITRKYVRIGTSFKWQLEHRAIAEKVLGRKLKSTELVHHINCDSSDNRLKNLLICKKDYHTWLHQRMGYLWAQERFANAKQIEQLPEGVVYEEVPLSA